MKQKIYKILFWVIILVIIPNCFMPLQKITHLSDEEMGGIDTLYNDMDTILFVSDSGDIDSMIITSKYHHDSYWPFTGVAWFEGFRVSLAYCGYDAFLCHNGKSDDSSFLIQKEDTTATFWVAINNLHNEIPVSTPYDTVHIGETEYMDCWRFDKTNAKILSTFVWFDIESFIWSRSKGLIAYKYIDGEKYYLKKLTSDF